MRYQIKVSDGTKIAVYDANPYGRETIVLVHGWPLSHKIFEYQLPVLLCQGFRVITMDLRGFGNSDMPVCGYEYDRLARDLYEIVKQLCLRQFFLGGFSMGGAIVLRYMRLFHGFGVKKLLLFAAASPSWTKRCDFDAGWERGKVNQMIEEIERDRAAFACRFAFEQLFHEEHSEAIKHYFESIVLSATGYATVQTAYSLRDEDGREDLFAVHVPTAVFQGAYDLVVPKALTTYQYECIDGAVLYCLENSGHGVMYDEAEALNQDMMEFLCG